MSSFPVFLASSVCALIVVLAALTAWLRGYSWEERLPQNITALFVWMLVFFVLGCVFEVS